PRKVKRPDHIIQLLSTSPNILLSIESKNTYQTLMNEEKLVGPKMSQYLKILKTKNASAERPHNNDLYTVSSNKLHEKDFEYKTGVAYYESNPQNITKESLQKLNESCKTDMCFCLTFEIINDNEIKTTLYYYMNDSRLEETLTGLLNSIDNEYLIIKKL